MNRRSLIKGLVGAVVAASMELRMASEPVRTSVRKLRTYKMDIREVIRQNALKDLRTAEDNFFVKTLEGNPCDLQTAGAGLARELNKLPKERSDAAVDLLGQGNPTLQAMVIPRISKV